MFFKVYSKKWTLNLLVSLGLICASSAVSQHGHTWARRHLACCLPSLPSLLAAAQRCDVVRVVYDLDHVQAASALSRDLSAAYTPHTVAFRSLEDNPERVWTWTTTDTRQPRTTLLLLSPDNLLEWFRQAPGSKIANRPELLVVCAARDALELLSPHLTQATRLLGLEPTACGRIPSVLEQEEEERTQIENNSEEKQNKKALAKTINFKKNRTQIYSKLQHVIEQRILEGLGETRRFWDNKFTRHISKETVPTWGPASEGLRCDTAARGHVYKSSFDHETEKAKFEEIGSICLLCSSSSPAALADPSRSDACMEPRTAEVAADSPTSGLGTDLLAPEAPGDPTVPKTNLHRECGRCLDAIVWPDSLEGRRDFRNKTFTVATFDYEPWMRIDKVTQKVSGVDGLLLQLLSDRLNFSYQLKTRIKEWGIHANGSWTGVIGMVERGEADIALNEITISEARLRSFEMSNFYFLDTFVIVTRAPGKLVPLNSVSRPFTAKVWAVVLVLLAAAGPVLRLLTGSELSLTECFLAVLRPMLLQGGVRPISSTRARLFLSLWFLYCFLISVLYSGVLYMHLTVVKEEKVVDSVEDLIHRLERGNFDVSLAPGSFSSEFLRTRGEGALGKVATFEKENWFQFQSPDEALDIIGKDSSWSIFESLTSMSALVSAKGSWKYHLSQETYMPNAIAILARKNSPLIPAINHVLKYIRNSGLVNHWLSCFQSEKENRWERPSTKPLFELSFSHLAVGFAVLAAGSCVATLVFFAEMCYARRQ